MEKTKKIFKTEFQQMLEITKSNYKEYYKHWNYRDFRNYKKRLKLDLENNPLMFSKYYREVKSSIYNPINKNYHGGKSNRFSHL
jgi:hypothetical protein